MELFGNRKFLLLGVGVVIVLLITGGAWILRFQKGYEDANKQRETGEQPQEAPIQDSPEKVLPAPAEEDGAELYRTETAVEPIYIGQKHIVCNQQTYIFETIFIKNKNYSDFNDIYINTKSPENFIGRLQALPNDPKSFAPLAMPKQNCDRIFLTRVQYGSDVYGREIFEWRFGEKEVHELKISNEFIGSFVPYPNSGRETISSDGEKMLIARPVAHEDNCDFRSLRFLDLRRDISQVLIQLSEKETLNNYGTFTEFGGCGDVNIGWLDNSTIYYDVYDSAAEDRQFIERRTLKIKTDF